MINYSKLSSKVEQCLRNDDESRNSDTRLYNYLLLNYSGYKDKLVFFNGGYCIPLIARYELPKEEDVCRIRRKLNSKGLYMPTDEKILIQRRLAEKEWHETMSPSNPSIG